MNPNLLTQGGSTVDGTSFTTESVSSTADTILVLSVIGGHGGGESANNIPSSINGLGLTWQLISSDVNEYIRITAYAATVAGQPSSPGAVTITFPSNMHACHWHLMSVNGASSSPIGQVKSWVGTDQNPVWSFDNTPQNDSLAIVIGVQASDTAAMGSTSGLSMLGSVVSTVASNASSAIYIGDPTPGAVGYTTSAAAPRKVGLAVELLADSSGSVPVAVVEVSGDTVEAGQNVTLLGGSSYDPSGNIINYNWSQVSGPLVSLLGSGPTRTFSAPPYNQDTTLEFSLIVTNDQDVASEPSRVEVLVRRNKAWLGADGGGRVPLIRRQVREIEVFLSAVSTEDGSGTATISWTINPGGHIIDGVYAGRDGESSTGGGPWESPLTPGLSGERTFNNLNIGEVYNLYIDVQVGGVRIDRWSVSVTPQGMVTPPQDDLPGWTLLYETEFTTLGDGWNLRNETQSNDNSRNIPANCVPGAIANGQGLIIYGKRESGYNRPYTSGEIDGAGSASLHVPSYFRAEIVGSHMQVNGLWPAMLWYRPIGTNDGEIDVHEYMGGRVENQQRQRYAVTMHNEYGSTQDSIKRPIYLDQLSNQDITAVRKFVIEKTPGQIKIVLDDEIERVFTASDKAWWNRIMESGHSWYPRITLQIGDGASNGGKTVVPEPPSSWSLSEMRIHSYKSWAYTP